MKATRTHWSVYAVSVILVTALIGAVLGAVTFPLVGLVVDTGYSLGKLALNGMRILGFYFGIWAPGLALVLTVKREYEARQTAAGTAKPAGSTHA